MNETGVITSGSEALQLLDDTIVMPNNEQRNENKGLIDSKVGMLQ